MKYCTRFGKYSVLTIILLTSMMAQPLLAREVDRDAAPTSQKYDDYNKLVRAFKGFTDIKKAKWNDENADKLFVQGKGKVEDVEEAGSVSVVKGAFYEVTVEINGGDRAVVFYPKTKDYAWVADLERGKTLKFRGKLKGFRDWGFWISGYLLGEQYR